MTKHGRRNRKKSSSEGNDDGKDGHHHHGRKGASNGGTHMPAVPPTTTKNSSGESICGWFSGLSWQDQAAVSSIEDTAFVATLLDLAAGSHHGGKHGNNDTWNVKFSLDQVEQVHSSNLLQTKSLRFTEGKATNEKMNIATATNESAAMMAPIQVESVQTIPEATMEEEEKGEGRNGSNVALDGSCPAPPSVESDAFRIQRDGGGGADTKPPAKATAKGKKQSDESVRLEEDNGILDHLRIIFPSAFNIVQTHPAFEEFRHGEYAKSESLQNPVITLDPLGDYSSEETVQNFDSMLKAAGLTEVFLSEERYSNCLKLPSSETDSSWIHLLRPLAQKQSNSVSLSLALVIRMECAILAAYRELHGRQIAVVGHLVSSASNEGTSKSEHKKENESPSVHQKESRMPFHIAVEAVKRHMSRVPTSTSAEAMDHMHSFLPKQYHAKLSADDACFVLVPFSSVLRHEQVKTSDSPSSTANLLSWNNGVEAAMKTLIDNAATSDSVEAKKSDSPASAAGSGLAQQSGQAPVKKSKKKKKKKKRKASNADQSTCSSDVASARSATAAAEENLVLESQRRSAESLPVPKSAEAPAEVVLSPKKSVAAKKVSVEVSETSLPSVGPHDGDADAPTQKVENTQQSDVVAVGGNDSAVGNDAGRTVANDEKAKVANKVAESSLQADKLSPDLHDSGDDHAAWETVEAKSRGNRNRRPCNGNAGRAGLQGSSSAGQGATGSKKNKNKSNSRRRNASRKMVREILSSVLDGVEVEVTRRRSQVAKSMGNKAKVPGRLPQLANGSNQVSAWQARPMTMRDVVLGRLRAEEAAKAAARPPMKQESPVDNAERPGKNVASNNEKSKGSVLRNKPKGAWVADQSTAPTVPETLSGISANTQTSGITDVENASTNDITSTEKGTDRNATIDYSSSGDAAVFTSTQPNREVEKKATSPTPPLQTLPWPATANSATSSVASSLEVPHSRHLHHRHSSELNENDVGYHLLDVCDRLSRDMDVFMGRRAVALIARRRERGALLAALQDTASKLWANQCHVEMYGSCATQLDLPSSDLDAVICGLDRRGDAHMDIPFISQHGDGHMSTPHASFSQDDVSAAPSLASQESQADLSSHPYSPSAAQYMNVPALSPSAERVIRLAAELERQPWAVQVKAIPTATVPVVKILADPSRLPGAVASVMSGGDWMMQQHHMAAQAAAMGMNNAPPMPGTQPPPGNHYAAPSNATGLGHSSHSHYVHHSPPPWRGADVMNGLFSVDITFEGPEHGGIGSTQYSAHFVQDACNEVGLPPDRAPVVQALMVLKELLAQRRLNEPFSGGLSSYALLLLVDAVLKERQAIKQEMEKIERQRQVVAAGDSNVTVGKQSGESKHKGAATKKTKTSVEDRVNRRRFEESSRKGTEQMPAKPAAASSRPEKQGQQPAQKNQDKGSKSKQQLDARGKGKKEKAMGVDPPTPKSGSSWACIAKKNTAAAAAAEKSSHAATTNAKTPKPQPEVKKSGTFADAVSNRAKATANNPPVTRKHQGDDAKKQYPQQSARKVSDQSKAAPAVVSPSAGSMDNRGGKDATTSGTDKAVEAVSSHGSDGSSDSGFGASSLFPQGSNDVLEVLCSGETTAGKLLLHFLLFYGRHFESHTTAVDLSGKHHPDAHLIGKRGHHNIHLSPFVPRKGGGSIDPVTGMLTVDPIVVYDPLEGAEDNNVARSCFAWSSIRWVFAQSYMTLSSAVERSGTPPATPGGNLGEGDSGNRDAISSTRIDRKSAEESREAPVENNMVSPLLELLLSF